jgi:hypothetical protein
MTQPDETTLTLTRGPGNEYALRGATKPARLTLSSWRSRGQIEIGDEHYELIVSGLWDRGASVFPSGRTEPVIRIARKTRVLPVSGASTWRIRTRWSGYDAELRLQGVGEIELHLGLWSSSNMTVVVRGRWPHRDLIILTAAAVLLLRRRDDNSATAAGTAAAVAATTS